MPWRCPACQAEIQHTEGEARPRPGERYRCHVCRLELVLDRATDRLTIAPVDDAPDKQRPTR